MTAPPQGLPALTASVALALLTILGVPRLRFPPATPVDVSYPNVAPVFAFLQHAATLIPTGASVTVRSPNADPAADTHLHRLGVALLPGHQVLPQAIWDVPLPATGAAYVIVVGPRPAHALGTLLHEEAVGTVWRVNP